MKVLIPVDGARNSKTAEDYAVELHARTPIAAVLFNVINTKDLDGHGISPEYRESIIQTKRKWSEQALAQAAATFQAAGIEHEKRIETGNPGPLICAVAQQDRFDLVIIAESGLTEFKDWFMGSVTNYVLYRCKTPVLLVKHPNK